MEIDFVFDTACPWCYIGKRRLRLALEARNGLKPLMRWRPFLLSPDMPLSGMDRRAYVERKFGGPRRAARILEAAQASAEQVGLVLNFDRITRTPNTIDSHRLVRLGETPAQREALLERVFAAYFVEGCDIGDKDELARIGAAEGLDPDRVAAHLASFDDIADIIAENARVHAIGMSGVPGFIFNSRYAIAGAQETNIFLRLVDLALETQVPEPVTNP
ncbi:DsbA family oxidoreductase [Pararhodospirillum photometricum]|uniref:DSBA oxidoreductase n=1 Tax=Pararhodospirillum photometricum DSM 122 TaxID=1150469 RepID=H6SQA4_PARPM|nr:DsbA family oxidoreductase [Pararhodospirillum photometricum]CCG09623.1 DSBA oxidoreductase [Pararhodospirillum photometricum DSM 122]